MAEHVDDVKASFGRWFEALKPGGRITITVPACRSANRMWLERKRFPALELGPDEGIIAVTTGVKADDLGDQKEEEVLHNRVFDESTLRICMEADLSTSPRSITTKRWSRPPRHWAGNSRSKVTNQSAKLRAEGPSATAAQSGHWVTLRVGCSRVSMRRLRTAHRAEATPDVANGFYGARRSIRHDLPSRV